MAEVGAPLKVRTFICIGYAKGHHYEKILSDLLRQKYTSEYPICEKRSETFFFPEMSQSVEEPYVVSTCIEKSTHKSHRT